MDSVVVVQRYQPVEQPCFKFRTAADYVMAECLRASVSALKLSSKSLPPLVSNAFHKDRLQAIYEVHCARRQDSDYMSWRPRSMRGHGSSVY